MCLPASKTLTTPLDGSQGAKRRGTSTNTSSMTDREPGVLPCSANNASMSLDWVG